MPALDNQRYEAFALQVAQGKPYADAYVLAGYKENDGNAKSLAQREMVRQRIMELKTINADRAGVTVMRVLAEYARIAFSDITQMLSIKNGRVTVMDTEKLPASVRAAIAEIRQSRKGEITIKLHPKGPALDALAKHLGLFKENVDLNVNISLADLVNGSFELERSGQAKALVAPTVVDALAQIDGDGTGVDASPETVQK